MKKCIRLGWLILFILCLQTVIGIVIIKPFILAWGATEQETTMPMPGDDLAPFISSTRSVTINAPGSQVWSWLIQLGADRGGFYSYWFIEKPMGYEYRPRNRVEPEFREMKVGRIVPASLAPSKSVFQYSWPVVAVEPGRYFVLKGWGCFLLNEITPDQTRLTVRTHGRPLPGWKENLSYFFMMPMHYLMERRMLTGIKARAEAGPGEPFACTADLAWFASIVLAPVIILGMAIVRQSLKTDLIIIVYSLLWLLILMVLEPVPVYGLFFLLVMIVHLIWSLRTGSVDSGLAQK